MSAVSQQHSHAVLNNHWLFYGKKTTSIIDFRPDTEKMESEVLWLMPMVIQEGTWCAFMRCMGLLYISRYLQIIVDASVNVQLSQSGLAAASAW